MHPTHTTASCSRGLAAALLSSVVLIGPAVSIVAAQSGSRPGPAATRGSSEHAPAGEPGSAARRAQTGSEVALSGHCAVCIADMQKWVRGTSEYSAEYDGKVYLFPSGEIRDKFLADPAKYTPALGGDCTVCLARIGKRVPGTVHHSAFYRSRLFLFPNEEQKNMFLAEPAAYADIDLAAGGACTVCQVEIGKGVPGKPEIAAYYKGLRYLFPAEEQRRMFLANPERYEARSDGGVSAVTPDPASNDTIAPLTPAAT
ncbi:MAG: hypothetical protein ACF8TS_11705, partial [Maioricimonas sp. JB049]